MLSRYIVSFQPPENAKDSSCIEFIRSALRNKKVPVWSMFWHWRKETLKVEPIKFSNFKVTESKDVVKQKLFEAITIGPLCGLEARIDKVLNEVLETTE